MPGKGGIAWNRGMRGILKFGKRSPEVGIKISRALLGKPLSDDHKRKIGEKHKGTKLTEEHKQKLREASLRNGNKPPIKKGEKNNFWKGGISFIKYGQDWTETLKESIRQRDNYICQECGIHQDEINNGQLKQLDVHHIDYNKDNLNNKNLITLCRNCHAKTNYNREYWIKHFNKLI